MRRVDIERIAVAPWLTNYIVSLSGQDTARRVTIWIGQQEAAAIIVGLEGQELTRPITQDLLASVLDRLDATVNRAVLTRVKDRAFHAAIHVDSDGATHKMDARASDALALAARTGAPIYAEDVVLKCGEYEGAERFDRWPTIWPLPGNR
jgi:bifunctional DNase/RNase